jgi:hypothetical protein
MLASTRDGNALSKKPWVPADASSLSLKNDEILSHINIVLSLSKRPGDLDKSGWADELSAVVGLLVDQRKIERGPEATVRQIKTFAPLPSKNVLARLLLYCWYTCLTPEFDESSSVEDLLKELRRIAREQGFITVADISKKPGRPPQVFKAKNRRRLERFDELRSQFPDLSARKISDMVAEMEKTRSSVVNRNIEVEVRRFLQRQGRLLKSTARRGNNEST